MDLDDVSAIVTGGASGIGAAAARALAALGTRCVIVDRNAVEGERLAAAVGGEFAPADVTDEDEMAAAVARAEAIGPLRAAVNAAGIGDPARTLDREGRPHDLAAFERVVGINLFGVFNAVRLEAAAMARTEPFDDHGARGAIVSLSSVAAYEGQIGQAAYSASKAAIAGMTLPVARDLASVGIRVNAIAPGLVDTPIYGEGPDAETMKARLAENVLYPKRLGTADEVASLAVELLTNDYMNGTTVRLDGGIRMPPR